MILLRRSMFFWVLTVFLLTMLCVSRAVTVVCVPICPHGHPGCQAIPLPDLFDRIIQHSARMHGLSNDLHSEFVSVLLHSLFPVSFFLFMYKQQYEPILTCLTESLLKILCCPMVNFVNCIIVNIHSHHFKAFFLTYCPLL